ncbi:hypothetical protein [Lactobacillus gasseri]|nr:hypothetical protein [Lactobacillus gasseri]
MTVLSFVLIDRFDVQLIDDGAFAVGSLRPWLTKLKVLLIPDIS